MTTTHKNQAVVIAFGELGQTLISKTLKEGNKNPTSIWGTDGDLPRILAVDTRDSKPNKLDENQAFLAIGENGTGGNPEIAAKLGQASSPKILAHSFVQASQTIYVAIAIGGGSQGASFAVADALQAAGKEVYFLVFDLFDIDGNDRQANAISAKRMLATRRHTYLSRSLSFASSTILSDIAQSIKDVAAKIQTLLGGQLGSVDANDAKKAVCDAKEFFLASGGEDLDSQLSNSVSEGKINKIFGTLNTPMAPLEGLKLSRNLGHRLDVNYQKKIASGGENLLFVSF